MAGVGTGWALRSLLIQTTLGFGESMTRMDGIKATPTVKSQDATMP